MIYEANANAPQGSQAMATTDQNENELLARQLRVIQESHDWLYREKERLQAALQEIANCDHLSTKDDLVRIAKRNLPIRAKAGKRPVSTP
jgi:uncharacterized protein YjcR